jgi:dipeptidyl aminopeptidase/acylaminoacyl peptidase
VGSYFLKSNSLITLPTKNGREAHMTFYPPKNHEFSGPPGEKPPLMVISHGGPTSNSTPRFNLGVQYWTTRGIAVADIDYGGSTGYGREYRQRLEGQWGIVDVEDCTNGALFLARQGRVDPARMVIRGGSAGGFTTLACLTFRDAFRAGASYFGVSDIGALARETHKFESRYMDGLVGPWPAAQAVYEARSPLFHTDQITAPVIFFQGLDDKIVLPNQAEMMVDKLRENHIPVAYIAFPGEGHGFRQAKNIQRATEAELYFYSQILGFSLATPIEPVAIENL